MKERVPIQLPKVGLTMQEGEVVAWLKAIGDHVAVDEPLVEFETEKITTEVIAPVSGLLVEIIAQPGAVVAVGDPLGFIESDAR